MDLNLPVNLNWESALSLGVVFLVGTFCIVVLIIIIRAFLGKIKRAKIGKILDVETVPESKPIEPNQQATPIDDLNEAYYKLGYETGEFKSSKLIDSQMKVVDTYYKLIYEGIKDILISLFQNNEIKSKMIVPILFIYSRVFSTNFKTLFKLTNGTDLSITLFDNKCKIITDLLLREYKRIIHDYYDANYFKIPKNLVMNIIEEKSYGLLTTFNNYTREIFAEARRIYTVESLVLNNKKYELDDSKSKIKETPIMRVPHKITKKSRHVTKKNK